MTDRLAKFRKTLWFSLGILCLGIAYVGVVTPGIPWSTPTVGAAYCFAKSNDRWHRWLMNHPLFGPFLTNWSERRVFTRRGKWAMVITMDVSLIITYLTTGNLWLTAGLGLAMLLVAVWAWRFPSTREEADARVAEGKKLGWF